MNYELILKLKEAGFPFNWKNEDTSCECNYPHHQEVTLEELIEACGDNLKQLNNHQNSKWGSQRWTAKSREPEINMKVPKYKDYEGRTPSEAVANLYLALNNKDNE